MAPVTQGVQANSSAIPLGVEILLGHEDTIDEKELEELLRGLFVDLALDVVPQIGIKAATDDLSRLRIRVAGQPCPVKWVDAGPSAEPAQITLARRVAASVYANADLLITSDVALRAAASVGSLLERMGAEAWTSVLRFLVERGFRVDRTTTLSSAKVDSADALSVVDLLLNELGATRVELSLGSMLYQLLVGETGIARLIMLTDGMFYDHGVFIPKPTLILDWELNESEFRLRLNDCRGMPEYGLLAEEILVEEHPDALRKQGLSGRGCRFRWSRRIFTVLRYDRVQELPEKYFTWDAAEYVVLRTAHILKERIGDLLTPAVGALMLTNVKAAFPAIFSALQARITLGTFAGILRTLLDSGICVRNLPAIIESILSIQSTYYTLEDAELISVARFGMRRIWRDRSPSELEIDDYVEVVREDIRAWIKHTLAPDGILYAVAPPEVLISLLRKNRGWLAPMDRERLAEGLDALVCESSHENGGYGDRAANLCILAPNDVRSPLQRYVRKTHAFLSVVSPSDLDSGIYVESLGEIAWNRGNECNCEEQ